MRASEYLQGVTVEPAAFFSTLALAFSFLSVQNLIVQKTCSPDAEPAFNFICDEPVHVAKASEITFNRNTFRSILSAVSIPLLGSWRDATGRNRCLIFLAIISNMTVSFMYFLSAWNWSMSPWIPSIFDGIIEGIFGEGLLHLAGACVITENSTAEDRTVRLQLYVIPTLTGGAIGAAVNGYLLNVLGYKWFFILVIAIQLIALIFAVIFVKDRKPSEMKGIIYEIGKKLKNVFKARANKSVIWIMLISGSMVATYTSAENNLLLYYLQQGFRFSMEQVGIYGAYRLLIGAVGAFVITSVLKILGWTDFKSGILSSLLSVVTAVLMMFASTIIELYFFAVLDFSRYILYTLPKSIISKCVENDELGSFLGVGSIVGIFAPTIINFFYNAIFSETSDKIPGAFFLVSAIGYALVLLSFIICSYLMKIPSDQTDDNRTMDDGKWKSTAPEYFNHK